LNAIILYTTLDDFHFTLYLACTIFYFTLLTATCLVSLHWRFPSFTLYSAFIVYLLYTVLTTLGTVGVPTLHLNVLTLHFT